MKPALKAAIYARVSTLDQSHDLQTAELRDYAARMGWSVVEYSEKASSVKKRPVFLRMMADARLRLFDVLIVWKLDRFGRSLAGLMENVSLLDSFGVRFICVTQGIDTDRQNAAGRLFMQMIGAFAEFERSIIVERVVAGVREAQRQGKHCGRPRRVWSRDHARQLQREGLSLRAIGAKMGVSHVTIAKELARC